MRGDEVPCGSLSPAPVPSRRRARPIAVAAECFDQVVDALGLPGVGEETQRSLKDKAIASPLNERHYSQSCAMAAP
ncbi:hypothetical protein AF335_20430 [Streptomyces eurocidicus]|uniref:Uncharacterized protein n=1 Tax=Streptomyces eurocidicus TaxID=66423 RepID=A0A2N8NTM7_STREU|nr:hypothetical protein [Streptomyces eurocidicus]MBB5122914.1 hypothetical protein [Streptomyces eurocidicus]MBF6056523.1 hypothetical protein [Streptomyces eurocidicus]PNE32107.1 hypothetical protein AF335_20430 [Streptomyces eurocidicus]